MDQVKKGQTAPVEHLHEADSWKHVHFEMSSARFLRIDDASTHAQDAITLSSATGALRGERFEDDYP